MKRYIGTKEIEAEPQDKAVGDGGLSAVGYAVKYPDGYVSWSPRDVFEAAYRAIEGEGQRLTFGDAIHLLKTGRRVTRAGWNGNGMWLALQDPDAMSKMGRSYVYMSTAQGDLVPWVASQTDMLAEDWGMVE